MANPKYSGYDPENVIVLDERRKSGGSPPGDGDLEARVAVLEAGIGQIRTDLTEIKSDIRGLRTDARADVEGLRNDGKSLRDQARTDFRVLFGALIVTTLGLAGLMARGFGWL